MLFSKVKQQKVTPPSVNRFESNQEEIILYFFFFFLKLISILGTDYSVTR